MKKFKKTKIALLILFIPIITVFVIRMINEWRYPTVNSGSNSVDITNMSTYPTDYENLKIEKISQNSLNGFHIKPNHKTSKGVIVTFGGSEGGCNYFQAIDLAENGYEVVALYFFGQSNQPKTLTKVPLEFFHEFLLYAQEKQIDMDTLTLLSGSKGAELSLVLTNYYDEIDNLVLYAPSSYVFQGLDFQNVGSSWTWNDQELPYISLFDSSSQALAGMLSAMLLNYPVSYLEQYETAVANSQNAKAASIDLSDFSGKILLFAGDKDAMWHSAAMAQKIYEANTENVEIVVFENVGHSFGAITYADGVALGGTAENNNRAAQESTEKLLAFLTIYHH